jgi:hypothetical protein
MQPSFADGLRSRTTAGLRQPLLVVRRWFVAKRVIRSAESHTRPRAAGVSPPWFGEPNAVRSKSCSVRSTTDYTTKSGGRQPAVGIDIAIYNGACTNSRQTAEGGCAGRRCVRVQVNHGGLTPPALALRCEHLPAKQRFLRCTNAHSPKSGGREPAVGGQTRIRRDRRHSSADRRRCVCGSPLRSRL